MAPSGLDFLARRFFEIARDDDNDATDDDENESAVSNSRRLQASYLVESYNLMAAIKFNSKNILIKFISKNIFI